MVLKVRSEKLRQLRRYAGLSQAQLAEAAQTTQMTIYRLEKEDTVIRLPTAFKLARALGCRMEDLTEQIPRLSPKKPPVKRNYKHGCILSGQKIKDLRKGLGWTQEYLAEKADICKYQLCVADRAQRHGRQACKCGASGGGIGCGLERDHGGG